LISDLLPFIVAGIVSGSLYGLAGLGLVLTYRTSGVFNFGYGAIAAAAAFAFYTLHFAHHLAWPLAALVTILGFAVVIGPALDLITRSFVRAPDALVVVATVGILLGVEGYLYKQYGDSTITFPQFLPTSGFTVSDVTITWAQVISIGVAVAGATAVSLFLRRTRTGVAMRAVVDNPQLVRLGGERPERIRLYGWMLGAAAAAISGILLAPTLNLDVNLLTLLVVQALGACAVGLFRSLPMTFVGGLVVGISVALTTKWITRPPLSGLPAAMPFIILIVVLLAAPRGKLPESRAPLSALIAPVRSGLSRSTSAAVMAIGGGALVVVPFVAGTKLPVWISALGYFVLFCSLGLLAWGSGQLSLCHASFLALGATTLGHLTHAGVPWPIALILSGVLTMPAGALVAIPAIRLSGLYLALATLGFGILMQDVVFGSWLMFGTNAEVTANRPQLGFITASDKSLYFVSLVVAILSGLAIAGVYRLRFGRLLRAMAETPLMLRAQGLSVNLTRLIVVCISAFFAGIAGALMITQVGTVSGVTFGATQSLLYVVLLGICGTRLIGSSVLAALLLGVLPGYIHVGIDSQTLSFGVLAVVMATLLTRRDAMRDGLARLAATSGDRRGVFTATPGSRRRARSVAVER
jgi:branched-subunit amino acid ABC-type transport system permease component